ncbi:MAG: imidazole glycerol phosphate synthase subunit HisH, partial [Lachnospiraceae bacterium]|nr:imidazole glycerol phosphate synthase subunit HisH [Lachnospiraceae bacterium]
MTGIIDYDAGNVKSVEKALQFLGEDVTVTRDPRGPGAAGTRGGAAQRYG